MDNPLDISAQIEALLFFKGEAGTVQFLAEALGVSGDEIREGLRSLEQTLVTRGIVLVRNGDEVLLSTAPQMGVTIEKLIKDDLNKDLGKAGLETLAIVLYRGPITRSEINYIRGVNSNYILRNLEVRGLIERIDKASARSVVYGPTFELLSYMGIRKTEDLPEYETIQKAVDEIKADPSHEEPLLNGEEINIASAQSDDEPKEKSNIYEEEPDRLTNEED